MNSDNTQPQGDSEAIKKLEEDLKNIEQQSAVPQPIQQPAPVVPEAPIVPALVVTPVPPETPPTVPENPKKGSPLMIVAIVLALIAVLAVVAYVFGAKLLAPRPSPTPVAVVTPSATPDPTANWKTYTNTAVGFLIKYPSDWRLVGTETSTDMIGFGPANVSQDVQWAINVYGDKTVDQIIADMGKQFGADRKVQQDQITVNGFPATKVTVTTTSIATWSYEQILINIDDKILAISNGATRDPNFDNFYNSFKFIGTTPMVSPTP